MASVNRKLKHGISLLLLLIGSHKLVCQWRFDIAKNALYYKDFRAVASEPPAKYFADFYILSDSFRIEQLTDLYNQHIRLGPDIVDLNYKLENDFAMRFVYACDSFNKDLPLRGVWRDYFAHPDLGKLTLGLLGASTHINGDMPFALAANFKDWELKSNRRYFRKQNKGFRRLIRYTVRSEKQHNRKIRRWDNVTLGLGRLILYKKIAHWRMRAYRVALKGLKSGSLDAERIVKLTRRANNWVIRRSKPLGLN